jgi:hypothetical protein
MEIKSATPRATTMSQQPELTVDEQTINNLWEEHLRTEFDAHSADEAIASWSAPPCSTHWGRAGSGDAIRSVLVSTICGDGNATPLEASMTSNKQDHPISSQPT